MKFGKILARFRKGLIAPEFIIGLVILAVVMIIIILFLATARGGIGEQVSAIADILG